MTSHIFRWNSIIFSTNSPKLLQFLEDSRNRHILKLKAGFNNYSSLYLSAAFPCNRTKQPARTLRVSFALVALSRRPWLWPVTVRRRLNSGRPAYSPTTSYFIFISILHMSKADSYKRQRGRPKPGPTAQNKPRELDPKGSHGLLCAYLHRHPYSKTSLSPRSTSTNSPGEDLRSKVHYCHSNPRRRIEFFFCKD